MTGMKSYNGLVEVLGASLRRQSLERREAIVFLV
jgi:hypothetical protein